MDVKNVTLSESQQEVVDSFPGFLLSKDKEMTISGFAGSGKTFLVQYLTIMAPAQQEMVQLLDPNIKPRRFVYTATTNKAADVLRKTVGQPTSTIHSTMGLRVKNNYKTGKQELVNHQPPEPLNNTVIFIDEASMINRELLEGIRAAVRRYNDFKLVFIGDKYQLPPVKEDTCLVFNDGDPNVHFLREIQRQEADSPIIALASKYRKLLDDPNLGWPELPVGDQTIVRHQEKTTYLDAVRSAFTSSHEPDDYRIVAWSNARVRKYNSWIRKHMGFRGDFDHGDLVTTNKPLFINDQIAAPTEYRLEIDRVEEGTDSIDSRWNVEGYWINFKEIPQFVFQPKNWDQVNGILKQLAKEKDWGPFFSIKENWADLRPIHASTVHKSQGSTYKEVFVDLEDIGRCKKWSDVVRLIYVAITRASHKVHIYGDIGTNHVVKQAPDTLEAFKDVQRLLQFG